MTEDRLSLYLDLEQGQKADLEVAAQAAIAFSQLVKEISFFLDPFSQTKLELLDSSEGSLFINALLKISGVKTTKDAARVVFIAVLLWLGNKTLDFAWEKSTETLWEQHVQDRSLSETEKNQIADIVRKIMSAKIGEKNSQRFYREIAKDPAIKGVGVSHSPKHKPAVIVPKQEFLERAGLTTPLEKAPNKRVRVETVQVVLISPVLLEGKRRWKFRSSDGEFGASIKDQHFLDSVLSGQVPIVMKRNVELTIEIETIEEFINGVWVPKERNVLRIIGIPRQFQGDQESLSFK